MFLSLIFLSLTGAFASSAEAAPFRAIVLTPSSAIILVGNTHTITATARTTSGAAQTNLPITFRIISGPNTGRTGSGTTNSNGMTTFSYSSAVVGTDTIVAGINNGTGSTDSDPVTATWILPSIRIGDINVNEGDAPGQTLGQVTVTLSQASNAQVTVNYQLAQGTASAGVDYVNVPNTGTITFAPGQTMQTINVSVIGDNLDEPNETFFVNLLNPSANATIADNQAVVTIIDDDGAIVLTPGAGTTPVGTPYTLTATVTDNNAPQPGRTVTFTITSGPNAGLTGTGVTNASGVATFTYTSNAPGTDTIVGSFVNAGGQTTVSNPVTHISILRDITINDVVVMEGDTPGANSATFTVTLSGPSPVPVTVQYTTANGTATAGSDYTTTSGTVTFPANTTTRTIKVPLIGDTVDEADETFFVNLSNPGNGNILDNQGQATIIDDDGSITLTPPATINPVGTPVTFTATVQDNNVPQPGRVVTFTIISGPNAGQTGTGTTNANGMATFTYTSNAPGTDTITATFTNAGGQPMTSNPATNMSIQRSLSINDVTINEGNAGTTQAVFTVTLSGPSPIPVTVQYTTANGTATAGSDYTATSGTLTFPANTTTQTISVPVIGDTVVEPDETFFVNLSNPTTAVILDNQGVGTIVSDDVAAPTTISINDVTVTEGDTGSSLANFTVTLSAPSATPVTVQYSTANGTATAGTDYVAKTGTVTFPGGSTSQTVSVVVNGDIIDEPNETFFVNLSTPTNATILDNQGVGTIADDDGTIVLSPGSGSTPVGTPYTVTATVTDNGVPQAGVVVTFTIPSGPNAGQTGTGTTNANGVATFTYTSNTPGTDTIIGTFTNAGGNPMTSAPVTHTTTALPQISINDVTVTEGNTGTTQAVFTVTLSTPSSVPVTVQFGTVNGTATAGSDYTATSGTLTFPANTTTQTISVPVIGDTLVEPNETFSVVLANAANATILDNRGIGTIINDDLAAISINDVTVTEGDTGSSLANFTVTLSAPSATPVTVQYSTANGTATAGTDYVAKTGTVTFPGGSTSQTVSVVVNGDIIDEPNETFFVNLSTPTNATILDNQGVGTIADDDGTIVLTPGSGSTPIGTPYTVTATVTDNGVPQAGKVVTFTITTGPNAGQTGTGTTNANGVATFTYTSNIAGTDVITGSFVNAGGRVMTSAPVTHTTTARLITINDVTVTEGNSGTTLANFTVSLSGPSLVPVTVLYATANGTATAGSDYVPKNGTVTFPAGSTAQTISVVVIGDTVFEPTETFFINLANATNAVIQDNRGVGTILNDDRAGAFSCRASALRVTVLGINLDPVVANNPDIPCLDGASTLLNFATPPLVLGVSATTGILIANTDAVPNNQAATPPAVNDSGNAMATVNNLGLTVSGIPISATTLTASAQAICRAVGATPAFNSTSRVDNLRINGTLINVIGSQSLDIPVAGLIIVHINNTTTTGNVVRQRALWVEVLGSVVEVVAAEAKADFSGSPCTN